MDLTKYKAKPDKTIQDHKDDLLEALEHLQGLGYIPSQHIYDLVNIACIYHDYGKMNPEFQKRVNSDTKKPFNENIEVAHNILSLYFLPKDIFENEEDYYRVGQAILNHHDYCDTLAVLQDEVKKKLIETLLADFKEEIEKIGAKKLRRLHAVIDDRDTILIKGFLHKCDYSASAQMKVEYPNDFLAGQLENLNYRWNELQLFCRKNTNKNIIAVAQTGMGKTEGGLHWIGNEKGFFILPIRTAINAIYDRIRKDILNEEHIEERVALLHSGTLDYYNGNLDSDEMDLADYYERGRKLSMPLTICTMDQLFDFVFKYNGYEMKLATLSYAKIVLDEIQMYSPDLLAYLICGIKKISELGGKVAIVTATLPPFVKDEIIQALGQSVAEGTFLDANNKKRHHVKVFSKKMNAQIICAKYRDNEEKNKSNKILVVCNTVKKAQEIFLEIKKELSDGKTELHLLHSRFTKEDRAEKEKAIQMFGQTFCDAAKKVIDYKSGIWVSTSIVEANLDIDFDYLFTELSDLNALFQRFGRCNRKGVKSTQDVNCFVFTEVELGKNLDKTIYELSKTEIEQVDGIIDENQKIALIGNCFTREKVCRSDYFAKYSRIKERMETLASHDVDKQEINLRNIMSTDIIPKSVYEKNETKIEEYLEALQSEQNPKQKAKYREYIRSFIVSIPSYIKQKNNSYVYERIPVFECNYDKELGFQELDYPT